MSAELNVADKGELCRAYNAVSVKGCGDRDFFALKHVAFGNGTQGIPLFNNVCDPECGDIFADYFK